MLDRRGFFSACVVLPLVGTGTTGTLPPREFRRYVRATDSWEKVTPEEIGAGDELWVFDPPTGSGVNEVVLVSRSDPADRVFYTTHKLDPTTNQWVPNH
jgi:hypothetical protein